MKKALLAIPLCMGLMAPALADAPSQPWPDGQELSLYESPDIETLGIHWSERTEWGTRLVRMQSAEYGGMGGFSGKAMVQWLTQPQPMVGGVRDFSFPTGFAGTIKGWSAQGGQYLWREQAGRPVPLQLNLALPKANGATRLDDYDELWVDYTAASTLPQCVPQIKLQGRLQPYDKGQPSQAVMWQTDSASDVQPLLKLDTTGTNWKEKDYWYLLGRIAGLAPDSDWRYAQDQNNAVLQRRLNVELDTARLLDIALAPGHGVERVNLFVSRDDERGSGELLEFPGLSLNATLPGGQQGVRLNLAEELARRFPKAWAENAKKPGAHHFHLREVILFMPGTAKALLSLKPVRSLTLLGEHGAGQKGRQRLDSRVVAINAYQQRMVVDLRKLQNKGRAEFTQAELQLAPPAEAAMCALHVGSVRMVSIYSGQEPTFAAAVESWVRQRGGPFERQLPESGRVEQPGIIGYLPMAALSRPEPGSQAVRRYLLNPTQDDRLEFTPGLVGGSEPAYRVVGPDGRVMAVAERTLSVNSGASLTIANPMIKTRVEGDALVLESGLSESQEDKIEIAWPLMAQLPAQAWVYFGMADGMGQIGNLTLTAQLADGRQLLQRIVPNEPLRLAVGAGKLTGLRLSLQPLVYPYRIKLRELALFAPSVVDYSEARGLTLPAAFSVRPLPVGDGMAGAIEARPGLVRGFLGDGPLHFSTPLEQEMRWVRALRLNFHLPPGRLHGDCPIVLQLNWTSGQTTRQLCPARLDDHINVRLSDLLGTQEQGRDLGALRSIDWTLLGGAAADDSQRSFSMDFTVEGWTMMSALDQLRLSPLFLANDESVRADPARFAASVPTRYSQHFWLPMEPGGLEKMAQARGEILPVANPLFSLDSVVAEPNRTMDWARWQRLVAPLKPKVEPPHRSKSWLWLGLAVLAWFGARKGWWSPSRAWRHGQALVCRVSALAGQMLCHLGKALWRLRSWFYIVMAVFGMGPVLWYAGRQEESYAGLMCLLFAMFLIGGSYRHWRARTIVGEGAAHGPATEYWGGLLLLFALGNVAWAVGHFGLSRHLLFSVLPVLGVFYLHLPCFFRLGMAWESRWPGLLRWLAWSVLVAMLYGLGLVLKVESGVNYFFTFGSLAAVPALRAAMLLLEPWLRRLVPSLAGRVLAGAGSLYFFGAMTMLAGTAAMLLLGLVPLAEQFAVVVYYCLALGTIKEIAALRRRHRTDIETPAS